MCTRNLPLSYRSYALYRTPPAVVKTRRDGITARQRQRQLLRSAGRVGGPTRPPARRRLRPRRIVCVASAESHRTGSSASTMSSSMTDSCRSCLQRSATAAAWRAPRPSHARPRRCGRCLVDRVHRLADLVHADELLLARRGDLQRRLGRHLDAPGQRLDGVARTRDRSTLRRSRHSSARRRRPPRGRCTMSASTCAPAPRRSSTGRQGS